MEEKMNQYGIVLDGKMDEPIWDTVEAHSGFSFPAAMGAEKPDSDTIFKVLPCEDRIYIGILCPEPRGMEYTISMKNAMPVWQSDDVEVFLSPAGVSFEFYQFCALYNGIKETRFYSENGNIQPDPYAPQWNRAIYTGDTYWSVEIEIPLTAFYMTSNTRWSDKWLVNITRTRLRNKARTEQTSWSKMDFSFIESHNFRMLGGFPMRPEADDVCMVSAIADLTEETEDGYRGTMTVKVNNAKTGVFEFTSDHADPVTVTLQTGSNEFTAPCFFAEEGRPKVELKLTRIEDGKEFQRFYPVLALYEPIKLKFSLPEYRNNFYPGQDYSRIVGTAVAGKPITLKLEGPGIQTQIITPNVDGSFQFETPDFEEGTAWLTALIDGYETKKKICRLAPTGRRMSWISGGNLVVDGKPILRRDMYARYYRGSVAFNRRYDADDLHETKNIIGCGGDFEPQILVPGSEVEGGEATQDIRPSEQMFRAVDEILERAKNYDFTHYYLSDEPECRGLSTVYFRHLYEYITDKDPYHVLLVASRSAGELVEIADWFEAHPYINPFVHENGKRVYERQMNSMGDYIESVVKLNRPDKCIGFLPTCFAYKWNSLGADYPDFDEIICHTWAAMIRGGKSLWPYAYHDLDDRPALYEGMRYIFSSFEALEEIVLLAKRTTLVKNDDVEAVLYEHGNEKMFALVNFTNEEQTVTLDGISGTWHEFRHDRLITGNTFLMKPLEVIVGTSEVKDGKIPTYQQVKALIDQQEYERTHSGSVFFDRMADMSFSHSDIIGFANYKLFDGMRDNLAFDLVGKGAKFFEMDQTKIMASIQKVIVYGDNVESCILKVRTGGELSEPVVEEVHNDEFAKTIILKNAVCPEALRFEFDTEEKVEVYEIEAY